MASKRLGNRWVGVTVAMSLLAAPTFAAAATPYASAPQAVSPLVALSFLASDSSRAALCGIAGANAATAAATTTTGTTTASGTAAQPGPVQGCVLPAVDAVPAPLPPVASNGFSLIGPLAALLAGLVAVLVLVSIGNQKDHKAPVSPA